ncbi:hypothetical protein Q8A73_003074 [Channa argus]|nr:hypothetical protein Q8A73_003074 [Channa argus]
MGSQNSSTEAELLSGSPEPEQVDSFVCPTVPEVPVSHVTELLELSPDTQYVKNQYFSREALKMEKQKLNEELFFSSLPDSLLTLHKSSQDDTGKSDTSFISDFNSSTAAELLSESPEPEQVDSSFCPNVPEVPVSHVTELLELSPQIHNVVSTAKLGCRLDLKVIACKARNVEYNPKVCKVLIMRIRKPRTTAMIYANGHVTCTGAKSEEQSRVAIRRHAGIVQKLGFPVSVFNFKIQNIMATSKSFPVNFEQLLLAYPQYCSYEPELFPGLFFKMEPGITVTIFASGKMSLCVPWYQGRHAPPRSHSLCSCLLLARLSHVMVGQQNIAEEGVPEAAIQLDLADDEEETVADLVREEEVLEEEELAWVESRALGRSSKYGMQSHVSKSDNLE